MDNGYFFKNFEFGGQSVHFLQHEEQNIHFTKIAFLVSFKDRDFRVRAKNQQNPCTYFGNIFGNID